MATKDKLHRTNKLKLIIAVLMTEVKTDGRRKLNSDGHMRGGGWKTERHCGATVVTPVFYFYYIHQLSIPPLILIISIQFLFAISS